MLPHHFLLCLRICSALLLSGLSLSLFSVQTAAPSSPQPINYLLYPALCSQRKLTRVRHCNNFSCHCCHFSQPAPSMNKYTSVATQSRMCAQPGSKLSCSRQVVLAAVCQDPRAVRYVGDKDGPATGSEVCAKGKTMRPSRETCWRETR